MLKRYHEAPLAVFDKVQEFTDGDYFLVHLFETNENYKEKAFKAVKEGREVILDNSIFELGEAFDMRKFAVEVADLSPDWYIVPDVLEDGEATCKNLVRWIFNYKHIVDGLTSCKSKMIATVQGKDYREVRECYRILDNLDVDKIAIPFDLSLYQTWFPEDSKLIAWSKGRPALIRRLIKDGVFNPRKKHHLLGCACMGEGLEYSGEMVPWLDSMDTSSPVVRGMLNMNYPDLVWGNIDKPDVKLYTLMDEPVSPKQEALILQNIGEFSNWWF